MQQNLYQSCYTDKGISSVSVPVFSKADEQVTAKQSVQAGAQLHCCVHLCSQMFPLITASYTELWQMKRHFFRTRKNWSQENRLGTMCKHTG